MFAVGGTAGDAVLVDCRLGGVLEVDEGRVGLLQVAGLASAVDRVVDLVEVP